MKKINTKENQNAIVEFGGQISEEFLYNEKTNTNGALMKDAWFKDKDHKIQWTKSELIRDQLIFMMLAIGLARKPSSNTVLNLSPPSERDNHYLVVDKGSYLKEQNRIEQVYGGAK